jgi:hypothetical protein
MQLASNFLLLLYAILALAALDPDASVTIDQLPRYNLQRLCGRGCIQNNYNNGNDIENELECTWNGCYCSYTAEATSIVKSCWSDYCGLTHTSILSQDISTALSLYREYCGGAGDGAQVPVGSTANVMTVTQSRGFVTVFVTVPTTAYGTSSSN